MSVEAAAVWLEYALRFHNFPEGLTPRRSQIPKKFFREGRSELANETLDANLDFIDEFDYNALLLNLLASAYDLDPTGLGLYRDSKGRWIIGSHIKSIADTEECLQTATSLLSQAHLDQWLDLGKKQSPQLKEWGEKMHINAPPTLLIHFST